MKRTHALLISVAIGAAVLAGVVAATRTIHLGSSSQQAKPADPQIAKRLHALDRAEIALRKALKQQPPKLPPLPKPAPAATPSAGAGSMIAVAPRAAQPAQRVVYVRPAPIIRHVHRPGGGEHESEAEGGSHGGDGGGGGFDD